MDNLYKKDKQSAISFPLGGIGTGCIGLSGNGQLIDWELFGRPNKDSTNEYSHFAIKAENSERVIDTRVLMGDTVRDFYGTGKGHHQSWGYGQGPNRTTMAGMPHFEELEFVGNYPFAVLSFNDRKMPAKITMEAFNPFIPMNDYDSSLPSAFFNFKITNTSNEELKYTIGFSVGNIFAKDTVNAFSKDGKLSLLTLNSKSIKENSPKFGNMTIATDNNDVHCQEYWYRGGWFDELTTYWKDFSAFGAIKERHYSKAGNSSIGNDIGTLTASVVLKPFETKNIRFNLSWYMPNFEKYWGKSAACDVIKGIFTGKRPTWKRYYAKTFDSSNSISKYGFENLERLYEDSLCFKNALGNSSLPESVIDAIQGNIAILKSVTCLRLADGEFYAFEGSGQDSGSCEGTCSHVWGYAYAMPFLFPRLERTIRELDYKYNYHDNGAMAFRLMLPLGSKTWKMRPCVDGQYGGIIKIYREWKISGDDDWLRELWPRVKKSIEWAWSAQNDDKWDREKNGYIIGRQHHTLDVELFGANSWLTGYYLAGLKAGSIMAKKMGDEEAAGEYSEIFERGTKWVEKNLFNGRHYIQQIDLKDKNFIKSFCKNPRDTDFYWNEEAGEAKYQYKEGSEIDQIVGQWHATLNGLGDIFDKDNRKKAAKAIYDINFKTMRDMFNPCRIFAVDDEKGLIICNWEMGRYKPVIPIPYTEEVMCGFEYAAACTMIQEGFEKEGLEVVAAIRERYDGSRRNPWSEMECGSSYARSMASYSLLLTYSGFKFDMTEKMIGFEPVHFDEHYNTFWSVQESFGVFKRENDEISLEVKYGEIKLKSFLLPSSIEKVSKILFKNEPVDFRFEGKMLIFKDEAEVSKNEELKIFIEKFK